MADPEPGDVALATEAGDTAYGDVVRLDDAWGRSPRVALSGSLEPVLRDALASWAADGSVVLIRGDASVDLAARLTAEGVTVDAR